MSKNDNCASVILAYLNEKNCPYNAQDVFDNLQSQHGLGKTAVVKAMEQLALESKIKKKTYSDDKIYFADQAQFNEISDENLKAMDCQISELSAELQSLRQNCKQLDTELKELNSFLATEEMTSEIQELKVECSECKARLEKIKLATNHVDPEEREKVYKESSIYVKEWKKRKRLASDMMNSILEGYPQSKKDFQDEVGVETDEDCKVTVPSI